MPRGVSLTTDEHAVILALHRENKSSRHFATVIGRGRDDVLAVITSRKLRGVNVVVDQVVLYCSGKFSWYAVSPAQNATQHEIYVTVEFQWC